MVINLIHSAIFETQPLQLKLVDFLDVGQRSEMCRGLARRDVLRANNRFLFSGSI